MSETKEIIKDDTLHKYLIKKIRRAVEDKQTIVHVSNKQFQIEELLSDNNFYTRVESLDELDLNKEAYSQVILDLDMPSLDKFEASLEKAKRVMFKHANLIIIASNMCSFKNKINFFFENKLEGLTRPNREVSPGFVRQTLCENGWFLKNRAWNYGDKILTISNKSL